MAYVTVDELKKYLSQWEGFPEEDLLFGDVIDRAQSIVDEYLGFSFDGYTSGTVMRVQSWGTQSLRLPPHDPASVFTIKYEGDTTLLTDWQYDADTGMLLRTATYPSVGSWPMGRYEVTGNWGYGTVPESVKEVTLELAVNIWRGRDRGMWTDIVGVEGSGGLRFTGGLTNQQRAILKSVKNRLNPVVLF